LLYILAASPANNYPKGIMIDPNIINVHTNPVIPIITPKLTEAIQNKNIKEAIDEMIQIVNKRLDVYLYGILQPSLLRKIEIDLDGVYRQFLDSCAFYSNGPYAQNFRFRVFTGEESPAYINVISDLDMDWQNMSMLSNKQKERALFTCCGYAPDDSQIVVLMERTDKRPTLKQNAYGTELAIPHDRERYYAINAGLLMSMFLFDFPAAEIKYQ